MVSVDGGSCSDGGGGGVGSVLVTNMHFHMLVVVVEGRCEFI